MVFFSFSYGPRNPPVIIPYTVYIEYTTYGNDCDVKTSSDKLKFYDLYDDYINVFVFGDSIAAGAHTPSQYFYGFDNDSFSGLLRNTFIDLGIAGEVNNLAINGGTTSFMSNNYHDAIYSDADVVIIELGMNDHINGLTPGSADQFRDDISEVVSNLLSENIDVILIGFFQQNELWVMEKSTETLVYNEILNKIAADYEIPFVDIRSEFISLDHKGIEDLTGDWMHHPNDFGHKVYYSQLVPYLFDEKKLGDIRLNDFLCIQ
jgi:acyl-CoA thioesterase-1